MSNINKRLKDLDPYVLSIRFTNGLSVVDTFFKEGWVVPKSDSVGFQTLENKPNYYMLHPLTENVGIDEILDFVGYAIKVNVEREMKIKLLKEKISELKVLFTESSLSKCKTLTFNFSSVQISEDEYDEINISDIPIIDVPKTEIIDTQYSDNPLNQDSEIEHHLGDEVARFNNETFDLPPKEKNKVVLEEYNEPEIICNCNPNDPDELCPKCINY
tara:strand:- start:1283 stop:1930 length:648 start_codon:yes stop_codon:yes gene_type:complete